MCSVWLVSKNVGFFNQNAFAEGKKPTINKASYINFETQNETIKPPSNNVSIWNDFDHEVHSLIQSRNRISAAIGNWL